MRKPDPNQTYRRAVKQLDDPMLRDDYPLLLSHLTDSHYEDGSLRVLSTLTLYVDNGGLTCVLNDRDNARSAFFNEPSVVLILDAIEGSLRDDTTDWKSKRDTAANRDRVPF